MREDGQSRLECYNKTKLCIFGALLLGAPITGTVLVLALNKDKPESGGPYHMLPIHVSGPEPSTFNRIFEGQNAELISGKHNWTEGPVVFQNKLTGNDVLMFSDVFENKMWIYDEGKLGDNLGKPQIHTYNSGGCRSQTCFAKLEPGSNGLAYDALNGHLLICQHGARAVSNLPVNITTGIPLQVPIQTVVNYLKIPIKGRFNSPNDIAIHPKHKGRIFFTDPSYGLGQHDVKELPFNGVYQVVDYTRSPVAQLVDKRITNPNGIAVSGDGTRLFVAESSIMGTMAYHVYHIHLKDPHSIPRKVTSFNFTVEGNGYSDGIKIDPWTGLLVSSCPQGICIVGPHPMFGNKSDKYQFLARAKFLPYKDKVSNMAFGTNYLYITGNRSIWRIKLRKNKE